MKWIEAKSPSSCRRFLLLLVLDADFCNFDNVDSLALYTGTNAVMDIVYTTHILLIHFITTRTFDMESLYHSTYFLTYPLQTAFYLLKTQKLLSYLPCSIYYIFCYIRVKGQHSRTCRVERSNLYSNTFLKWQVRLKCFRGLKTALNHYINLAYPVRTEDSSSKCTDIA